VGIYGWLAILMYLSLSLLQAFVYVHLLVGVCVCVSIQVHMTPELLMLNTYDRLFQRLVLTHKEIPLGIYRTSYLDTPVRFFSLIGLQYFSPHCTEMKFSCTALAPVGA